LQNYLQAKKLKQKRQPGFFSISDYKNFVYGPRVERKAATAAMDEDENA
jgi:hypothetical protein